jgi:ATP-dependent Clp protease ATP-binding subunit ClpA
MFFLGLIRLGQGIATHATQKLGLDLKTVGLEVEQQIYQAPVQPVGEKLYCTPAAKEVIARARLEAKNRTYVGTGHLLLGLLADDAGLTAKVLRGFNVDINQIRPEIDCHMASPNSGSEPLEPVNFNRPFLACLPCALAAMSGILKKSSIFLLFFLL